MSLKVKTKALEVLDGLRKRYPVATSQLAYGNPWELLVATILAAQCTDARVNLVTPEFFSRWPGPAELARAELEEIEQVIHSTGFFHNKAKNLLACARKIQAEHKGIVPRRMDELVRLPGVARKTANVVLFAGYGLNEGLAVDTHVRRITFRLGLTGHSDPVQIEKDLMDCFPKEEWGNVNHRLVWFGRDVCKARKPLCEECEFYSLCPRLEPPPKK